MSALTLTQSAGAGLTTFNGAVDTSAAGGVSLTNTNLAVNNTLTTTGGGTVTVAESGTATFAAAGDINADGSVSLTAAGGISTAGDVTTTNDSVFENNIARDNGAAGISVQRGSELIAPQ